MMRIFVVVFIRLVLPFAIVMAEEEGQRNSSLAPRRCFDVENPPSCTPQTANRSLHNGENYNAQDYCYLMQRDYFYDVGPFGLYRHMEALSSITVEDELCPAFRQVYHLCIWCSPLDATYENLYYLPTCDLERPLVDESIDVKAACQELRRVFNEKVELPATIELCHLNRKISHLCVEFCYNADPNKACLSIEKPPSCDLPSHDDDDDDNNTISMEYDAQAICYGMAYWWLPTNALEIHGAFLSTIHADSEYCRAVRAFYHQCFWCVTAKNDDNTTITLPSYGSDYCKIDCFNVPQVDPDALIEDNDMNATCEAFSSILERNQYPSTLDSCESYRQMGHLCPQLECGKYNYDSSKNCFSAENLPTCKSNIFVVNEQSMDYVQNTCFTLASEYLTYSNIWNVSSHVKGLSMIHMDSDLCHAVKRVYHLCHWCSQDATVSDCSIPDCVTLEPSLVVDSSVHVASACQELTNVLQREELPATIDLCYKLKQVSHLCPAVCGNYSYQPEKGCFTEENPPSCSAPLNDDALRISLDEQEICNTLFVDYLEKHEVTFDTSAHLTILSKIPAHSEFCAAVQSVYHRCFWCAPYAAQTACSQHPPRIPYCSAPLALLRANVNNHQICVELEQVYENYSDTGPMTIDLCEGLERFGDICPNLCIYVAGWKGDDGEAGTSTGGRGELCFKTAQDLPNCSATTTKNNNDTLVMDEEEVNHLCFLLDREIWNNNIYRDYEDMLPKILANSELCYAAQHAYHLCYWCTPSTELCGYLRKSCVPNPPETVDDPEEVSNLTAACTKLNALRNKREWAASSTMCIENHAYGPWCPDYCDNGFSKQGCFNYDQNPPTCQAPSDVGTPEMEYDVQDTCYKLLVDYLYPEKVVFDLSSHGQVLIGIHEDSELCLAARQAYHMCYWCDATQAESTEDFCAFDCSSPAQVFNETIDIGETCQELTRLRDIGEWPATTDLCRRLQQVGHLCPGFCENFDPTFIMVSNPRSMAALSRTAAILSLLGSVFILWDVLSSPKNRATVYHQLLGAMAVFDIVTALAWIFARLPIPKTASFYVEGAMGTQQTCTTQAFFVQLGFTSVLYNVSLSSYYVLVIARSWRESDLRKKRWIMHGIPLIVGIVLAVAGIPFYQWYVYGCHLLPPPHGELWIVLVFAVIPLGFSVSCITVSMLVVYLTVRRNARASRKWSFGVGKTSLEAKVFWQALLYTLSFYITWPIFFSVYIASTDYKMGYDKGRYALPAIVSFVAPLQGFTNFLVYIRPRLSCSCRSHATMFGSVFSRLVSVTKQQSESTTNPATSGEDDATFAQQVSSIDPSAAIAAENHHPAASILEH